MLLGIFFTWLVVAVCQLFIKLLLVKFVIENPSQKTTQKVAVSVVIYAKNDAENLNAFLPSVIEQDYPNFEIILINNASYDKTLKVMNYFANNHKNIKIVDVKNIEAFWGNKKYALTLGIKASKNDSLLFIESNCKPLSNKWIHEMSSNFSTKKSIILGHSGFTKIKKSFLNKIIRFDSSIKALLYFSFAKLGNPFMGINNNIAYTKNMFFNANGFMNHIKIANGEAELFVNQIANSTNTTICFSKESFTESMPVTSFKHWFKQKKQDALTLLHYKQKHKILIGFIYITQLLFWFLVILLLAFTYKWQIVSSLLLFYLILQYIIYGMSLKKLNENDLLIWIPFLEIFLISVQLTIFIHNLIFKR